MKLNENILKKESQLLSLFRKLLPEEKGLVLKRSEELLPNLSVDEEAVAKYYPKINEMLSFQKVYVFRYLAFLTAVYLHEKELKKWEYEKDTKYSQLKDERAMRIAKSILSENKRGKKPKKRQKLYKLRGEILALRKQGLGPKLIAKYLWKAHRLKVSREYVRQALQELEKMGAGSCPA